MRYFFRLLLTGKDNETFEIARVLLFVGVVSLILFTGFDVISAHRFDPLNFSTGLGGLLFGGSSGIAIKDHTEPSQKENADV